MSMSWTAEQLLDAGFPDDEILFLLSDKQGLGRDGAEEALNTAKTRFQRRGGRTTNP